MTKLTMAQSTMAQLKTIVLATNNAGKVTEFEQLLRFPGVAIIPQSELGVTEIEETGRTFIENALLKARHATQHTQLPVIADDSGLIIDALNGAPGIYSARYAGDKGNSTLNYEKVLHEMQGIPTVQRTARFHCCLAYVQNETSTPIICSANWEGYILETPQGMNGFGYDPIFYVPTHDCSAAELNMSIKNEISHRAQALQLLQKSLLHIGFFEKK